MQRSLPGWRGSGRLELSIATGVANCAGMLMPPSQSKLMGVHGALRGIEAELARPGHDLDGPRGALDETRRSIREDLADARTAVELEGPEELARMAGELTTSLSACATAIQARTLGREGRDALGANESHRIRRFLNHASNKLEQFVSHARKAIDVWAGDAPRGGRSLPR
ncbi:hypothetical protein [Streptomyces sp. NPDC101166]|uniref:hypothetical protein n=1 Tax=Streptomyces sp. NPDC101166 TaxID=3366120 RepID=UPI00381E644D